MTKEALKLALVALEEINQLSIGENAVCLPAEIDTAMDAIKEALAQPEQEPVAWEQFYPDMGKPQLAPPHPWEKFCDSNCVWTDHHPDCKLAQPEQKSVAMADYMALTDKYVALKAAQPEQDPVAWAMLHDNGHFIDAIHPDEHARVEGEYTHPLYTSPPHRTWVWLTLDERIELAKDVDWPVGAYCEYAEKIEAKLKEKNT